MILVGFVGGGKIHREGYGLFFFNEWPDFFITDIFTTDLTELLIDTFLTSGNCELIAAEVASEDKYSASCLQGARMEETSGAIFGALSLPLTVLLIFFLLKKHV